MPSGKVDFTKGDFAKTKFIKDPHWFSVLCDLLFLVTIYLLVSFIFLCLSHFIFNEMPFFNGKPFSA